MHAGPSPAVRIEIVAEQWWWRIRYPGFETANEIRIPAGRPVELVLRSADVIHSFWVPSLAGKVDMIPGRDNRLLLIAQKSGEFRGQCAEFCGGPHAKMALHVIAEDPERFETWMKNQLQVQSSHALFLARCAVCHTVRGTAAAGTRGPDLTHVGSRGFIAAVDTGMRLDAAPDAARGRKAINRSPRSARAASSPGYCRTRRRIWCAGYAIPKR